MTRFGYFICTYSAVLGIAFAAVFPPVPRFIWNASASVPTGLYALRPASDIQDADLVLVRPPPPLAVFMAKRRYLPIGVPMIKHIAAKPGQTVCRNGSHVTVDGAPFGDALAHDRRGRPLPVWQGCVRLPAGQVFLMNPASRDSFDGRYLGALPATVVIARAIPVWTQRP